MSKIDEGVSERFPELSKFQKIVLTVAQEMSQEYPTENRAKQIFVSITEKQLVQFNRLMDLWKKYYRSSSQGDVIGTACRYLWDDIKKDEEERENVENNEQSE